MSSDIRIDPSTTTTHLDYGENSDDGSGQQKGDARNREDNQKPYLDHHAEGSGTETRLKSRKTKKKKKEKKNRRIAERNTRQQNSDHES